MKIKANSLFLIPVREEQKSDPINFLVRVIVDPRQEHTLYGLLNEVTGIMFHAFVEADKLRDFLTKAGATEGANGTNDQEPVSA